jgi:hypothetical protein
MARKDHWQRLSGVYRACFCDGREKRLHKAGAEVLANLRDLVSYERSPFTSDALRMAYNVGQQDVVKHILQIMELTDEQIARLDSVALTETTMELYGSNGSNFN